MTLTIPDDYCMTTDRLSEAIDRCADKCILVIGDNATDFTYHGAPAGKSKDADVDVFLIDELQSNPGCAGNVELQCQCLCSGSMLVCDPCISVSHIKFVDNGQHIFRATQVKRSPMGVFQYDYDQTIEEYQPDAILFAEYDEWGKGWLGPNLEQVKAAIQSSEHLNIPRVLSLRTMFPDIPDIPVITNCTNKLPNNGYKRKAPTIYTNEGREVSMFLDGKEYCQETVWLHNFEPCRAVGAGDAFSAGLVAARTSGMLDWEEAIEFASIAAASFIYTSSPHDELGYIDPEVMIELTDLGTIEDDE